MAKLTATQRWLDAAKRARGFTSDYQLCKALDISSSRMGNYRNLVKPVAMDNDIAVQIAELAGVPPILVISEIEAERAKTSRLRFVWLDLAKKAATQGKAAGFIVAILAGLFLQCSNSPGGLFPTQFSVSSVQAADDANLQCVYMAILAIGCLLALVVAAFIRHLIACQKSRASANPLGI